MVVLESLASKFLETETLADRASDLIKAHNKTYNPDGDFMASERRGRVLPNITNRYYLLEFQNENKPFDNGCL